MQNSGCDHHLLSFWRKWDILKEKENHPHLVQLLLYLNGELFRELLGLFFAIFFTKFHCVINEEV